MAGEIMTTITWLPELFNKALPQLDARITNGIKDIETALAVLRDAGVINSPDYWRAKAATVPGASDIIIDMADKCRNILDRIVEAEATDEDELGRQLVANVIFNRVNGKGWPNTIYGVVFQNKPNIQFSPISDKRYWSVKPSALTRKAVDEVLGGADKSQGATYFRMIKGSEGSWHERALTKLFTHGNHIFYIEK